MIEKKPTPLLQKIFDLRRAKKITLEELGKAIGVKRPTAAHIENGTIPLKAEHIPTIAKLLGVEAWELFVDEKKEGIPLTKDEEDVVLLYRKIKNRKK